MAKLYRTIVVYLVFILVGLSSIYQVTDPDLGWHLRYGSEVWHSHQLTRTNTYSSQLVGYDWVNSSWGLDVLRYIVFDTIGFQGLSVFGALCIVGILYISSKVYPLTNLVRLLLISIGSVLLYSLTNSGFRGQHVSLVGSALVLLLVTSDITFLRRMIIFVVMFLLWTNIHGQVVIGLTILSLWYILQYVWVFLYQASFSFFHFKRDVLLLFCCVSTTLINPWGIRLYTHVLEHVTNKYTFAIVEFRPLPITTMNWWFFFLCLTMSLLYIIRSKLKLDKIVFVHICIGVIFTIASYLSRRYTQTAIVVWLPLAGKLLMFLHHTFSKKFSIISYFFVLNILVFLLVTSHVWNIHNFGWSWFCTSIGCSDRAAKYVLSNHHSTNVLTAYEIGGWLIWNYPDILPSIDGRMSQWSDQNNFSPFGQYMDIASGKISINQSHFTSVLVQSNSQLATILDNEVQSGTWQEAYFDTYAKVYTRILP